VLVSVVRVVSVVQLVLVVLVEAFLVLGLAFVLVVPVVLVVLVVLVVRVEVCLLSVLAQVGEHRLIWMVDRAFWRAHRNLVGDRVEVDFC